MSVSTCAGPAAKGFGREGPSNENSMRWGGGENTSLFDETVKKHVECNIFGAKKESCENDGMAMNVWLMQLHGLPPLLEP